MTLLLRLLGTLLLLLAGMGGGFAAAPLDYMALTDTLRLKIEPIETTREAK